MKRPPKRPARRKPKKAPAPIRIDLYKIALQLGNAHVPSPTFGRITHEARKRGILIHSIGQAMREMGYTRKAAVEQFKQHFIELFKVGKIQPTIPLINTLAESAVKEQYDRRLPRKR